MKKVIGRYLDWGLSVLVGIGIFLFWYLWYPHALSYQEQYQLFLWTWDYFVERISLPGGFADWLGEFIVQFYYVEWLGALLWALLFVAFIRLAGWIPAALLLWLMGDPSVLLGYTMAIMIAVGVSKLNKFDGNKGILSDIVLVPFVYWLAGPLAWVYVGLRIFKLRKFGLILPLYLLSLQLVAYRFLLLQWTHEMVFLPEQYYRIPMTLPSLMWIIPVVVVIVQVAQSLLKSAPWIMPAQIVISLVLGYIGITSGYDKDMYELIRLDYLVRNERWDEIVKDAQKYQVKTPFWSNCVNLALAEKRLLADRMFDFYQSGADALIMPRTRDLTSMLPSAEAFWRLGMVNSAQRYMFDTQESILNAKKSGRCIKRIAECMIVNGHYQTAAKQLDLLKKSLFYRSWAKEAEAMMKDEAKINAHPIYGKLRQLRYKENFLYNYDEIDKMFALLFMNNQENKMALDYFMAQMLLKGNLQGFQQYMGAVQQFGGYRQMPLGYQDVMRCIQMQGRVPDSPYAKYVERMRRREAER